MGAVGQHEALGDYWLGFQRAVAVVWRDPYPNTLGGAHSHYWFVRYLNLLDE
jgi:hypothetical protein